MSNLMWIGIAVAVIFLIILIINIVRKTFSITKFLSGFNIFAPGVQGKLMYYLIIGVIVVAVALGLYGKLTMPTMSTDYKNNIRDNGTVQIDQRTINPVREDAFVLLKLWKFKILSVEGGISGETKITNKVKEEKPKILTLPKAEVPIGYEVKK